MSRLRDHGAGLLQALTHDLTQRGYRIRTALADTIGAAWAIAHAGESGTIVPSGEEQATLAGLSVAALRLPPSIVSMLDRLDLRTVGDLPRLPRNSLPSRFGPALLRRWDQALGITGEQFSPERLRAPLMARWSADDPLTTQQELAFVFRQLLTELLNRLAMNRAGIVELQVRLRAARETFTLDLRLSRPTADERHLRNLLALRCERERWPGGLFGVELAAPRIGSLSERQTTLLDAGEPDHDHEVSALIERLASRLGEQAVLRPVAVPDAVPECSLRLVTWLAAGNQPATIVNCELACPWNLLPVPLPLRVLTTFPDGTPARLHWHNQIHKIVQTWGPERIEAAWWRGLEIRRENFRVETDQGHHLWVFRDRNSGQWFLHGTFD